MSHKNDQLFDSFLKRGWVPNWEKHPKTSPLEMVIIEPRELPELPFALCNMSCLLPYACLTIIHSNKNKHIFHELIPDIEKTNIKLFNILPDNFTRDEYSKFMTSTTLWNDLLSCERILIFQCDSGMRYNDILRYMQYDYIGAPWPWRIRGDPHIQFGNGGFSLRNRNMMTMICKLFEFSIDKYESEDIFFASHIIDFEDAVLPTKEIASNFSVEYIPHHNPMGFHQAWRYYASAYAKILLEENLDSSNSLTTIELIDAAVVTKDGHKLACDNLLELLRLSIGPNGIRISKDTYIPYKNYYPGLQKILVFSFIKDKDIKICNIQLHNKRVQETLFIGSNSESSKRMSSIPNS